MNSNIPEVIVGKFTCIFLSICCHCKHPFLWLCLHAVQKHSMLCNLHYWLIIFWIYEVWSNDYLFRWEVQNLKIIVNFCQAVFKESDSPKPVLYRGTASEFICCLIMYASVSKPIKFESTACKLDNFWKTWEMAKCA